MEMGALKAEGCCGSGDVPAVFFERLENELALEGSTSFAECWQRRSSSVGFGEANPAGGGTGLIGPAEAVGELSFTQAYPQDLSIAGGVQRQWVSPTPDLIVRQRFSFSEKLVSLQNKNATSRMGDLTAHHHLDCLREGYSYDLQDLTLVRAPLSLFDSELLQGGPLRVRSGRARPAPTSRDGVAAGLCRYTKMAA